MNNFLKIVAFGLINILNSSILSKSLVEPECRVGVGISWNSK